MQMLAEEIRRKLIQAIEKYIKAEQNGNVIEKEDCVNTIRTICLKWNRFSTDMPEMIPAIVLHFVLLEKIKSL